MAALTSLLVRDRVVSIYKIEEALQRQVLEGGEIDTALLELAAAPENVLNAYRAASFGLSPASRAEIMSASPAIIRVVPKEIAEQYRVVPISIHGPTLTLALATPLAEAAMPQLREKLGAQLEFRIATEARIEAALAIHYGIEISSRLRLLAAELEKRDPGEAPMVEPLRSETAAREEKSSFDSERPLSQDGLPGPLSRTGTLMGIMKVPASRETIPGGFENRGTLRGIPAMESPPSEPPPTPLPEKSGPAPDRKETGVSVGVRRVVGIGRPSEPAPDQLAAAARPAAKPAPPAARNRGKIQHRGPLTPGVVQELLASASDRDTVAEIFFSFARQYFDCAVLLAFRENRASVIYAHGAADVEAVGSVSLPLEEGGALLDVQRSLLGRITDLSRQEADLKIAEWLSRASEQPAALFPVSIRRRAVLCLYGDRGGEFFELEDLSELIETLPKVGRALERVLQARKILALRSGRTSSVPPAGPARAETPPPSAAPAIEPQAAGAPAVEPAPEPPPAAGPSAPGAPVVASPPEPRAPETPAAEKPTPAPAAEKPTPAAVAPARVRRSRLGGIVTRLLKRSKPSATGEAAAAGAAKDSEDLRLTEPLNLDRAEPSIVVNVESMAKELVDKLCATAKGQEGPLLVALLRTGDAALPELVKRFPGPVWAEPAEADAPLSTGYEVSAIARALISFGDKAADSVGGLLSASSGDARKSCYALLVARELPCERLLKPVVERLDDPDARTRRAASEALRRFRAVKGFDDTLFSLRNLASPANRDTDRRLHALEALAGLRDTGSIQTLIGYLDDSNRQVVEAARRALVLIALQDFGSSTREWSSWFEANRHRHRVEWLIDALMHPQEPIRFTAGHELDHLTQQKFGYDAASPEGDREQAQRKYRDWWDTKRFGKS